MIENNINRRVYLLLFVCLLFPSLSFAEESWIYKNHSRPVFLSIGAQLMVLFRHPLEADLAHHRKSVQRWMSWI